MLKKDETVAFLRDRILAKGVHYYPPDSHIVNGEGIYFYSGYGSTLYTPEIFFDSIMLSHFGNTDIGINSLKIYLNFQEEDGFIRRNAFTHATQEKSYPWTRFEIEEHAQPFLFQTALFLSRMRDDISWLSKEMYSGLKRYLEHWLVFWDRDSNGLCEWNSAQHGCSDNAFDRAGTWRALFCEGVDLNCWLYMEYLAAEKIAAALGQHDDKRYFASQAELKKRLIQELLWNDEDGFFYDRDIRTGKPIKVKHCHCLHPLECGIATKEQAERIVEKHVKNPQEFWSKYPVPSYAMNELNYTQYHKRPPGSNVLHYLPDGHCNWRGGLWPHAEYWLCHGLMRYGFTAEAIYIASRCLELVEADPGLYEWYNPETGEGQGGHPFHAGAEVLMAFLKTELETGFNPFIIEDVEKKLDNSKLKNILGIVPIEGIL